MKSVLEIFKHDLDNSKVTFFLVLEHSVNSVVSDNNDGARVCVLFKSA